MAFNGRPSQSKRKREIDLKEKRMAKEAQRALRKDERAKKPQSAEGEEADPDIAGIVPGPQPKQE